MQKRSYKIAIISTVFSLCLIGFNIYYFFIWRGVGLDYYISRHLGRQPDLIETKVIYSVLVEKYANLNRKRKEGRVHVFIGDSITKGFNIHEFHGSDRIPVLNRGIFFDTTVGIMNRVDSNVNNLDVESLFLMIGYNDLGIRADDEILGNIEMILARSRARNKFVQSILPVNSLWAEMNGRIVFLNKSLSALANEKGYIFIDLHSHFTKADNGGINPYMTYDGVHLNYRGYKLWYDLIKKHLNEDYKVKGEVKRRR